MKGLKGLLSGEGVKGKFYVVSHSHSSQSKNAYTGDDKVLRNHPRSRYAYTGDDNGEKRLLVSYLN